MNITPTSDRVLVRRAASTTVTASGIELPFGEGGREQTAKGEVIAVGPGRMNEHGIVSMSDVRAGDQVLFRDVGVQELQVDGEKFVVMREDEILAVIES